jgi:hypothetical protein
MRNVPAVSTGDRAEVMVAIAEGGLTNNVSRGENSGRKLEHSAVTRKLWRVGVIEDNYFGGDTVIDLRSSWKRENLKIVVFVQERVSRRVLGAASIAP